MGCERGDGCKEEKGLRRGIADDCSERGGGCMKGSGARRRVFVFFVIDLQIIRVWFRPHLCTPAS